jgi:NADH-quinone oxidoreductase subunit G
VSGNWNGFNVLHRAAARVGGLDLGLVPGDGGRDVAGILDGASSGEIDLVYLLGADEIDMDRLGAAFVVYQGHHGDAGAHRADVVLPGAAYTEKDATYVNTEGRVQHGRRAIFPPGDAREDWTILRALSDVLGCTLGYDNITQLRARMAEASPVFAAIGVVPDMDWGEFGASGTMESATFGLPVDNFYMTDPISRVSETMAKCSQIVTDLRGGKTGTDG